MFLSPEHKKYIPRKRKVYIVCRSCAVQNQVIAIKYESLYKSRGEARIAEFLSDYDIAFQYEHPLAIMDRNQLRIWYPDFRLPEYGMIIEYFGVNGNNSYNEQIAHKIQAYSQAGVDGIYLLESSLRGNWQEGVLSRIEQSLEGKLRSISSKSSAVKLGA